MNTAILFLIFNRPETTQRVFEKIALAKPKRLYVAADGARANKAGEDELCNQTRMIINQVNWECDIKKLYRSENLGCKIAVSSAIDWFFENEEMGIILEDDCLPEMDFFTYCEQLLHHYKNDERVMHIGGSNFQKGHQRGKGSYYFSNYNHIWGWASWRRAWKNYDVNLHNESFQQLSHTIDTTFKQSKQRMYWRKVFKKVLGNEYNTWDYQWTYTIWKNKGVSIIPNVNLISNIGLGSGTHTDAADLLGLGNLKTSKLNTIRHPEQIIIDDDADLYALEHYFAPSLLRLYWAKARYLLKKYGHK